MKTHVLPLPACFPLLLVVSGYRGTHWTEERGLGMNLEGQGLNLGPSRGSGQEEGWEGLVEVLFLGLGGSHKSRLFV